MCRYDIVQCELLLPNGKQCDAALWTSPLEACEHYLRTGRMGVQGCEMEQNTLRSKGLCREHAEFAKRAYLASKGGINDGTARARAEVERQDRERRARQGR